MVRYVAELYQSDFTHSTNNLEVVYICLRDGHLLASVCTTGAHCFTSFPQPLLACVTYMDDMLSYSTLRTSSVMSQASSCSFAQGLDSSRSDCLLSHTFQGVEHTLFTGKEGPGLQCTFAGSGGGHPAPQPDRELLTSSQPHLKNHSTLVPESDQTYWVPVYNGPDAQLGSDTQFLNIGSPGNHWGTQDHSGEIFGSIGQKGNGDVSKYARSPLIPRVAEQAMVNPHCPGLCVQLDSVAELTSVDNRGVMASTMKPPSARQHLKRAVHHSCGWIREDGTRCNTSITYECTRHLAIAHGIRHRKKHLKILCCWCSPPKPIRRSSMLRHVREVHLECSRSNVCT